MRDPSRSPDAPPPPRMLGERLCAERGLDVAETFRRQFVLSERPVSVPPGWLSVRLGPWTLAHCPLLDLRRLVEADGTVLALVLGVAIDADGRDLPDAAPVGAGEVEAAIEGLAGRYVAIARIGGAMRFYVDPSNSLTAFHDPVARRVGASVALVTDREPDRPPSEEGHHLFFGDTMESGTSRLLGNHFLDLSDFSQHRHWPREEHDLSPPERNSEVLDAMIARQRAILTALIDAHACALPLTGGLDSRFLLACAGTARDRVRAFYTHVNNVASYVDGQIAAGMCERLGLSHRLVSSRSPDAPDAARIATERAMVSLRSSFQLGPADHFMATAMLVPADCDVVLRGGLVELTRANKWKAAHGDDPAVAVDPMRGLRAMAHPGSTDDGFAARNVDRYAAWMETLPASIRGRAPDFAHCELWLPTTNNLLYAAFPDSMMLNAFNDRALILNAARLPYRFRRNRRPQAYALRNCLPALADMPYATAEVMRQIAASGVAAATGRDYRSW